MKNISRRAMCIIAGISGVFICGCISHERTVYEEVPRSRVEFENDKAARVFYETLSKAPPRRQSDRVQRRGGAVRHQPGWKDHGI
jgi:hypothetical protein